MASAPPRVAHPAQDATTGRLLAAFGALYVIWGSTYLAIRIAIETLPPLLMASVRFLVTGTLLYAWARSHGAPRPSRSEWRSALVVVGLLFVAGNGSVVVSEQWVASGRVALLVASVPLWMVLVDWLWGSGSRPGRSVVAGLLVGFAGVAFLAGDSGTGVQARFALVGSILVVFGSLAWAGGSVYARHARVPSRPSL